jgi:hypothetical protein
MKLTGSCLLLSGFAVAAFFLVDAAVTSGGGAVVTALSVAAAVLAGVALLRYGGTGYRQTNVTSPAVKGLPGKSCWR